jgi:hypothetical protein
MTWDDARIAQERAICERATDAPWLQPRPFILFKPNTPTPTESPENWLATFDSPHDATFAAHARTALPEALGEITRLRTALQEIHDGLTDHEGWDLYVDDALDVAFSALNGGAS